MSTAPRYADDHDAAMEAAPAHTLAPQPPLVLSRDHVWDVLHALEQKIGSQDWDMSLDEQDVVLERLAHEAALLGRLAYELRVQHQAPYEYPEQLPDDPAAFFKALQIELRDERDGEPEEVFNGTDFDDIVGALHHAVSTCRLPSTSEISERSANEFFRLAELGRALNRAAIHAGSYVSRRHHGMERLQRRPSQEVSHE